MDGGKRKCCTRDTCAVYRATSSEPPDERQQQLLATQSSPASSTGRNSTQILYVEPNFTETPSEYEVFYDCFNSDYSLSGSGNLSGSFCAKPKDLARITKRIGDAHEFRGSLQQIVYTSRKLLKSFDEAYRKDGKCRRSVQDNTSDALVHADTNIRKAHSVEMTARVGTGAGGAREIQLDQCTIRIEPISFKIPLKVEVQSRKPSHTCHMTTMIQHTCQLGPKPTLEPIRTAAITAKTTQTMGPLPVQTALLPLALPPAREPPSESASRELVTGDSKPQIREIPHLCTGAICANRATVAKDSQRQLAQVDSKRQEQQPLYQTHIPPASSLFTLPPPSPPSPPASAVTAYCPKAKTEPDIVTAGHQHANRNFPCSCGLRPKLVPQPEYPSQPTPTVEPKTEPWPVQSEQVLKPIPPPKPKRKYYLVYPQYKDLVTCSPCRYEPSPIMNEDGNVICPHNCGCCLCPWKKIPLERSYDENTHKKLKVCKCRLRGHTFTDFEAVNRPCSNTSVFDLCPCRELVESKCIELYGHEMWTEQNELHKSCHGREVLLTEVVESRPKPK